MKIPKHILVIFFASIAALLNCATALAQSPQTFVSAVNGNDSGNCPVNAPCRTVSYAISQVNASGQVLIVDSGNYDDTIVVTKNVTIAAAPGVAAIFSNAGSAVSLFRFDYGPTFCTNGGACHNLTLRNLTLDGQGVTSFGMRASGINLLAEDCTFTAFFVSGVEAIGSGLYQFKNCIFRAQGIGLSVAPSPEAERPVISVVVEACRFEMLNYGGILLHTLAEKTDLNSIKLVVRDSLFNRAEYAVESVAGAGGSISVDLERCEITNSLFAVSSHNSGAITRVSNSTIVGNTAGLSSSSGGLLLSRGNNTVEGNNTNGSFTGMFQAK